MNEVIRIIDEIESTEIIKSIEVVRNMEKQNDDT